MGPRARAHRHAARGGGVHDPDPGQRRRRAAQPRGHAGAARGADRLRPAGRRHHLGTAAPGRGGLRPADGTRAHPRHQPAGPRVAGRHHAGPARADPAGAGAAPAQAGRDRHRHLLPGARPHEAGAAAQRAAGVADVRGVGPRGAAGHRRVAGPGAPLHDRVAVAPVGGRAAVRGDAGHEPGRELVPGAAGHVQPACAGVLRRGHGVRAARGRAALEGADPHHAQAGPRVRGGARAGDAEPRGPRLQGPVEHRHVDGRPAADRARQEPAAGGAALRERGGRRRRGRRHDQRPGQARVPAAPGWDLGARACSPRAGR